MHILTLSTTFPNPQEPGLGIFVQSRLERAAAWAQVRVVAPVALADYSRVSGKLFRSGLPLRRTEGRLEILHPRWLYPPKGGALNAACLFARCWPLVRRLDRESRIDLIDAHFGHPDGIAAALLSAAMRRPFVVTLRGNETMHARFPARRAALRWALRRAAGVIAVSGALRDFAVSLGAPAPRVAVIPNGVDTAIFHPRPRHGRSDGVRVVLSAGYLIERKGHHHVMRAVARLRARGIACELWIAGGPGREGAFEGTLRRLAADLGLQEAVRFWGAVSPEKLAELMSESDVLCLASSREGWPNVAQEALACGTPVVATRVGGIPEMIPSPEFGLIVEPGGGEALEAALETALWREWNREAIARWGTSRSWESVAREVVDFWEQAARRR